jgi:hypothetical protein
MPKITRDELLKLENLPDAIKADLSAMFTDVEERDKTITELRKKSADADEVVKRSPVLEQMNREQTEKINLLTTELAKYTGRSSDNSDLLGIFKPFFLE